MPLCTAAVLAATMLSGPAAVPPDPAPPGTRATTNADKAASPSSGRAPYATLPGMASQAGEFPFTLPQTPPWMTPGGMDDSRDGSAAKVSATGTSGTYGLPGADTGKPEGTTGGTANETRYVPVIDPKTRDVFIQPVFAPGASGEVLQPFTFRPLQGVQSARSYPSRAERRTPQQKEARQKAIARHGAHPRSRG